MVLTTVLPAYTTVDPATSATARTVQPCKLKIPSAIKILFITISVKKLPHLSHPQNDTRPWMEVNRDPCVYVLLQKDS